MQSLGHRNSSQFAGKCEIAARGGDLFVASGVTIDAPR
jgi:hypothetical protein